MHIHRMRLVGFKSFVEPTELSIETGLTGVVGPNGCGKSNLLEALRWVMGETSYKSMRATAMDDVIFSGTSHRPARAMAEVTLFIDNTARTAPAEFNDSDDIQVTRRIEREQGSAYRINGREARARDIKILFEDAATGARSPALVRQGQIAEIVNAKPEQRRRIIEDAAGIAGLHSRRHEAELRLKAAEGNLARIGDILGQLKSQVDALKRQARQARRYADLSDELRKLETIALYLTWQAAQQDVTAGEAELGRAMDALGAAVKAESEATRAEAALAETLGPLRDDEATRGAVVARLQNAHVVIEKDAERARTRLQELDATIRQIDDDIARETSLVAEAGALQTRLAGNLAELKRSDTADAERENALETRLAEAKADLQTRENELSSAMMALSQARAERSAHETSAHERKTRVERLEARRAHLEKEKAAITVRAPDEDEHATLVAEAARLSRALAQLERDAETAEAEATRLATASQIAQDDREMANLALRQLQTEIDTLSRLLATTGSEAPAIADALTVTRGFETALGAALGDDLDAPNTPDAPIHWRLLAPDDNDTPPLPHPARPLSDFVSGAPELDRRLRQTGIVTANDGPRLQDALKPGQRLVSKQGALWRWDGFVAQAGAPTPAAQRFELRNRLAELEQQVTDAETRMAAATTAADGARSAAGAARETEQNLRATWRRTQAASAETDRSVAEHERISRETQARLAALSQTQQDIFDELQRAKADLDEHTARLADLPTIDRLETASSEVRSATQQARDAAAEARAEHDSLARERAHRQAQRKALEADIARWRTRAAQGENQIAQLQQRLQNAIEERDGLSGIPAGLDDRRQGILTDIARAEKERQIAADRLVAVEAQVKEAHTAARTANERVSQTREERARADARLEASRERRQAIIRRIREKLDTTPDDSLAVANLDDTERDNLPTLDVVESRLSRITAERERLGGVNLQATHELAEMQSSYDEMDTERADVEAAIHKLRGGIASLNREGRKRLKQAFEDVDRHFRALFTTLFGGGEARLEMLEDPDDPLSGGLEIIAKPPGKTPTSLSLLSGGEQTLTALSLIFAVFLTNPSPICVLDEVDAPLDDANVDRFCTLMEKMGAETDTRFLVITHHPMTMARMDRLYGVTMVDKGVSQLVSVDLAAAVDFLEAG